MTTALKVTALIEDANDGLGWNATISGLAPYDLVSCGPHMAAPDVISLIERTCRGYCAVSRKRRIGTPAAIGSSIELRVEFNNMTSWVTTFEVTA